MLPFHLGGALKFIWNVVWHGKLNFSNIFGILRASCEIICQLSLSYMICIFHDNYWCKCGSNSSWSIHLSNILIKNRLRTAWRFCNKSVSLHPPRALTFWKLRICLTVFTNKIKWLANINNTERCTRDFNKFLRIFADSKRLSRSCFIVINVWQFFLSFEPLK